MGILMDPSTEFAKETRKWEAQNSQYGAAGRPYVFREYPKRLYSCRYVQGEGYVFDGFTVNDATEEQNMKSRGFFAGQDVALAHAEKRQTEEAKLAAEREYNIKHGKHSPAAVKEIRAAEAEAGAVHLPDVPRTPGRPRKPKADESE